MQIADIGDESSNLEATQDFKAIPTFIDFDLNLSSDQQFSLFKIFTGINVHYLLRDLECVQLGQMNYQESDIYKIRPDTFILWDLVETNIDDVIDYARFCINQTKYFPLFSFKKYSEES